MAQQINEVMVWSVDIPAGAGTTPLTIPEGYVIWDVIMNIQVVLGGSDAVLVGITGDTDAFLRDADVGSGAQGYYRASDGGADKAAGYKLGSGEDVLITRSGSTSGGGEVYVLAGPAVS